MNGAALVPRRLRHWGHLIPSRLVPTTSGAKSEAREDIRGITIPRMGFQHQEMKQ